MEYSKILNELNNASLFELYHLKRAIWLQLEDPKRINLVKKRLQPGQEISYFDSNENRLTDAVVIKLNRTRTLVKNKHDGKLWNVPFYQINIDDLGVDINAVSKQKVDRNSLKVGDHVCFEDKNGVELFGEVIKLNPKTAGVLAGKTKWRVAYGFLSIVIDGELANNDLLEGEVYIPNAATT
ncbi:MAG: hypothetical protein GY862_06675 [Gammaproteobacteria bacterium]|nr:hypothetical protein [Gammaproteobacteria bacterium]